jgi:hypothetical protein
VGVILFSWSALHLYDLSFHDAERDQVAGILLPFLNCGEYARSANDATLSADQNAQYQSVVEQMCIDNKLPPLVLITAATFFALLTMVTSFVIRLKEFRIPSHERA